jgi:hypothetical protein
MPRGLTAHNLGLVWLKTYPVQGLGILKSLLYILDPSLFTIVTIVRVGVRGRGARTNLTSKTNRHAQAYYATTFARRSLP